MRLASLTLSGFKSFGDRTSVEIAPGITALIGPNGSGKSNLIDALRWATGGGRASSYRASDKRDLIFHGADGKRGVGLAEVEVEFEVGDRSLKIVRSLDRDGTSRLRLNGRGARLLDVDDALAGSGLGRSGVAVIGQGEIGEVLMADPERLLAYVAEAAGVSKLSGRRDLTAARLDTARQHLERLGDILGELGAQRERLALEAQAAASHAALGRESLQLRFTVAAGRRDGLRGEVRQLLARQVRLGTALEQGRQQLHAMEQQQRDARAGLRVAESELREAQALRERQRAEVRVAQERLEGLEQRRDALRVQRDGLAAEIVQLVGAEAPVAPEGDLAPLLAREAEVRAGWRLLQRDLAEAQGRLTERQAGFDRTQQAESERLEHAAYARARRDELGAQRQRTLAELAQMEAPAGPELDAVAGMVAEARTRAEAAERAAAAASTALELAHARHASASAEAQALARAAERQRSAHEARRGYADGPRLALTSGLPGVLGAVADVVRVPSELRVAVAVALGRRAEYALLELAEQAPAVLGHVRRLGGWVTLLPLDLVASRRPLAQRWRDAAGVVGVASELVTSDQRFDPVVSQLLGGVLIMDSYEQALALATRERNRPELVTLDGTRLAASGAVSGGRAGQRASVVGAATEIEDAEAAAAMAAAEEAEALTELDRVRGEHQAAQAERRQVSELLAELRDEQRRRMVAAEARSARLDALEVQLRRLDETLAATELPAPTAVPDLGELAAALTEERRRVDTLRDRVEGARGELDAAQRDRLLFENEMRSYRTALELFERQRARVVALEQLGQRLSEQLATIEAACQEARVALERSRALPADGLEARQEARDAAEGALEEAEMSLRSSSESQANAAQELEQCRVQLARREAGLELAIEELSAFPAGLAPLGLSERAARARLREVEVALEVLGPVNHRAGRDYEETSLRHDALAADLAEASAAVEELETALTGLDTEASERYQRAIEQLRLSFARHVEELFGAEADCGVDVEMHEGRHRGLGIRLTPPGKRTEALGLLSVGERTMGALAFLFALMADGDGDGLPVAVLDEVDAPLDEANIRRYCAFLERLAIRGTQFVLVTHQKATFEVADVLWGVTTEQGVSRVFSIRKEEGALQG